MEGTFSVRPSVCFEVQKITAVSIGEGNQRNYQVQWAPTWISSVHLVGCEHLIEEFISHQNEKDHNHIVVDDTVTDAMAGSDHTQSDQRQDVAVDHSIPDLNVQQHFNEDTVRKRASMVIDDDSLFENPNFYSNPTNDDNTCVKVLSAEIDSSVPCTNPNFEWVEKSSEDLCTDGENNLISLQNDAVASTTAACSTIEFEDDTSLSGIKFMDKKKVSCDNGFPNILEVKGEEIIVVKEEEIDQCCSLKDSENRLNKQAKTFECKTCQKTFKNSAGLTKHSRKMHSTGNISEGGIYDKKSDAKTIQLKQKITKILATEKMCTICGNLFPQRESLLIHMRTHKRMPTHKCSYCEKIFVSNSKLKRHLGVHTNVRPFACDLCEKAFKRKDDFQKHRRTAHEEKT